VQIEEIEVDSDSDTVSEPVAQKGRNPVSEDRVSKWLRDFPWLRRLQKPDGSDVVSDRGHRHFTCDICTEVAPGSSAFAKPQGGAVKDATDLSNHAKTDR
jgi:hypothetical protein